ncbi:galanin receptor type 1-like [Ptychodera flava]|uniref:galanin receptor type 1-like n=1 Tax=Ptychodera flava TaxID=63121 RepID=UPI00396A49F8
MDGNNTTDFQPVDSVSSSSSERLLTKYQTLILNSTIGTLGVVGNLLVCIVFSRMKGQMRTLTNLFIFNQSAIDLTTSVSFLIRKCSPSIVVPAGVAGDLYCMFWKSGFVSWSLLMVSSLNLTALTLERYLAVVHPITYRNKVTRKHVMFLIPFIWLIPFLLELFWAFANFNNGSGKCYIEWYSVFASKFSGILYFMEEWLIPLGVIVFSYTKINLHLRGRSRKPQKSNVVQAKPSGTPPSEQNAATTVNTSEKTLTPQQTNTVGEAPANSNYPGSGGVTATYGSGKGKAGKKGDTAFERSRRNVTKTMFVVAIAYLVCWTPQAIWFLLFNIAELVPLYSYFHDVTTSMAYVNLCINPIIYAFQYQAFRMGLKNTFLCCVNKVADGESSQMYSSKGTSKTTTVTTLS